MTRNSSHRKYKYAHIFLHPSTGWNLQLVEFLCDPENGFNIEDHLFVTGCKSLYDAVKDVCHIEYCENSKHHGMEMINMYGDSADWLIVHSIPGDMSMMVFYINKRYLQKIIWRTWGHDVYRADRFCHKNLIKHIILQVYSVLYRCIKLISRRRLRNLAGIGIGSIIDAINIKESLGLSFNRTYVMHYLGKKNSYEVLQKIPKQEYDDGYYHVMIGHSGLDLDRHCQVLDRLKRYEGEKIMLHVVLAYGDAEYIKYIKQYAKDFWHGRIEIIENMVEFEEYARWMNKMDAVILDGFPSYALGNLYMSLFLQKKLFLNRDGILQKGLLTENIPFHYTDEISGMSFEQFSKNEEYTIGEESSFRSMSYAQCVDCWKNIYKDLANA